MTNNANCRRSSLRIVVAELIAGVLAAVGLPIIVVAADLTFVAHLVFANADPGSRDTAFALRACASTQAPTRLVAARSSAFLVGFIGTADDLILGIVNLVVG